jgi:hypothetical protein
MVKSNHVKSHKPKQIQVAKSEKILFLSLLHHTPCARLILEPLQEGRTVMASCDWRYTGAPTAPTLRKYMAVLPEKSSKHGSSTNKTMGISRKNISS